MRSFAIILVVILSGCASQDAPEAPGATPSPEDSAVGMNATANGTTAPNNPFGIQVAGPTTLVWDWMGNGRDQLAYGVAISLPNRTNLAFDCVADDGPCWLPAFIAILSISQVLDGCGPDVTIVDSFDTDVWTSDLEAGDYYILSASAANSAGLALLFDGGGETTNLANLAPEIQGTAASELYSNAGSTGGDFDLEADTGNRTWFAVGELEINRNAVMMPVPRIDGGHTAHLELSGCSAQSLDDPFPVQMDDKQVRMWSGGQGGVVTVSGSYAPQRQASGYAYFSGAIFAFEE